MVLTLLTGFICLTVQFYYILDRLRFRDVYVDLEIFILASCSLIIAHLIEFALIFSNGNRITKTWWQMVNLIYSSKKKYGTDEIYKQRINDLLIMIELKNIKIEASGLFPIDLTVVTSIVSSITTYLIVLVQFKFSEDQSNNSTKRTASYSAIGS